LLYASGRMSKTIFLAGATGAIGQRLVPLLLGAGYTVHGLTRSAEKAAALERSGVRAIVGDVYDAAALTATLKRIEPEIVVHQLTDLPASHAGGLSDEALARNARIRVEGTQHLVDAALASGASYIVAQSLISIYAAGREPHVETDELDTDTRGSVIALERLALESVPMLGSALRFGMLYGPATWYAEPFGASPVHVDAAANATLLAIERRATGAFNIAEEHGFASSAKAQRELGWSAGFRLA
jgi:nucleoside-diphosphate-sugar epimerase